MERSNIFLIGYIHNLIINLKNILTEKMKKWLKMMVFSTNMLTSSTTTFEVHILDNIVAMKLISTLFFHQQDHKIALFHCQAFKHCCQTIVHDTYFHDFNFFITQCNDS
jgi:hypothetical protein